jgi:hypothetical protein
MAHGHFSDNAFATAGCAPGLGAPGKRRILPAAQAVIQRTKLTLNRVPVRLPKV